MTSDLDTFFDLYARPSSGTDVNRDSYEVKYAAAALMIACAKSDFEEDPDEEEVIVEILKTTFNVSDRTLDALIQLADKASTNEGLESFTSLVNEFYTAKGKFILIENLWRVAYADGRLDKYEDQFIHKIALMTDVSNDDVDRAQQVVVNGTQR